jgi:DNA-binding transcriptional MerR regulator
LKPVYNRSAKSLIVREIFLVRRLKRIATMATQPLQTRADGMIPDRLYFKIGDVAAICAVAPSVLRFWESQFPQLKPNKSGTGQRLYRKRDVELALDIKRLVHGEGYTLSGARQALEQVQHKREPQAQPKLQQMPAEDAKRRDAVTAAIGHARAELREIAGMLAAPATQTPRKRGRVATMTALTGSLFPS